MVAILEILAKPHLSLVNFVRDLQSTWLINFRLYYWTMFCQCEWI